ncbi:hypothetical protein BC941DRAFT_510715 [Chlamydoabsidia padenii]|nr:hypothetical protein BC941DRAFT_510715 [Chlamydoabsidia padenii]
MLFSTSLIITTLFYYFLPSYCFQSTEHVFQVHSTPLGIPWQGPPMNVSRSIYDSSKIPFQEHNTELLWLGMQLDYTHVEPLLDGLNTTNQPLLSRGEAHITVIDPVEYQVLSRANITIDDLNYLARQNNIQSSGFDITCIGKVTQDNNTVYQLIVASPALIGLREKVFRLYYSKQGNPSLFDPHAYWPHITIGFTDHDLFISHGVYKGVNACFRPVNIV